MKKKVIGIIAAIVVVLGLSLVVYNQIIPNEYVPAADEIALQKIRDGEPLGGKSRAEDDFATADDEDDFLD